MRLRDVCLAAATLAALLIPASATQSAEQGVKAGAPVAARPLSRQPLPLQPAEAAGTAPAPGAQVHPLEAGDLAAWLDGVVPYALKSGDIAGMVIIVVKDGQVLLQKGYGYADVAAKRPMDPERTLIRPGSTSKLFTWTAVMQLVQAGRLDLDRNVNDYLDFKIPERFGRPITLRDLMNHRAGFEEGLKDILTTDPRRLQSTEAYLKDHPRPLLFAPGEVPAYSNYGAALAGYIVQRVSGQPFDVYVEQHIFQPLGMTHTTFRQPLPAALQGEMSKGYRTASGPPQPYELITTAPAGSAAATASDMGRFMLANLQDSGVDGAQILDPATLKLMHSPSEIGPPGFAVMAHGFFHDTRNGLTVIGHGGDTLVFHTELDMLPDQKVGIFYSFNSRGRADAVYGARQALFDGFMDRYFPAPQSSTVTPPTLVTAKADAQAIAGRYQSSRRIEHGFLSALYLLNQSVVVANGNGTITAPAGPVSGPAIFREIGPQLWRIADGSQELKLVHVGGVKTVLDSEDPTSVLQAAPFVTSAPLTLLVLFGSLAILLWTLALWPLSPLLRAGERAQSGVSPTARRMRLVQRGAALVDVLYLLAWLALIQPLLSSQIQIYGAQLDPVVRALQIAGLFVLAAAAFGLWGAWRLCRAGAPRLSRVWSVMVAAALLGVVWIGVMGRLMSWNLNY